MLLGVDEALARIRAAAQPTSDQTVALSDAAGRVLRAPVVARMDQPPFPASAMDGYAMRAADLSPGAVLTQIGVSQAGARFSRQVGPGECVRIFTGAPVPVGADTVVMQEETQADGARITFAVAKSAGANIRSQGNDFSSGTVLIEAGALLTPAALSLAAAGNIASVSVAARPRAAIIATGDELVLPGRVPGPDQIIASNSFGLAAILAPLCASVTDLGIIPDERDTLGAAIAAALEDEPDVLVTTGGASVGEHDYVKDMLEANGVAIDFWRIAMRPGKPLMVGRKGKALVFGLPGNPVSALVTAHIFVVPALHRMMGCAGPRSLFLSLSGSLGANGPRRHFVRARLVAMEDGRTGVAPIAETDSGHLSSLALADCLIVQREHSGAVEAGETVEIILL